MLLLFWHTAGVTAPVIQETMLGGGEEDLERARSAKRRRKRELEEQIEQQRLEAQELRDRLEKAEQDRQRKAKAKADSKAKRAIEARIERFTRELAEAEADITLLLAALAELQVSLVDQEMIRRRKLLLIAVLN